MKKMLKKIAVALVAASIVCASLPMMAFAADRTYQVTFSAGELGVFDTASGSAISSAVTEKLFSNNNKTVTYTIEAGTATVTAPNITVGDGYTESAYKEVTAAGKSLTGSSVSNVAADAVYVMQYEAALDTKTVTAQYVDENGIEVAPSQIARVNNGTVRTFADAAPAGYTFSYAEVNGVRAAGAAISQTINADTAVVYHYTTNTSTVVNTVTETVDQVTVVGVAGEAGGAGAGAGAGAAAGAGAGAGAVTIPENTTPQGAASGSESASGSTAESGSSSTTTIEDNQTPEGAAPAQAGANAWVKIAAIGGMALGFGLLILLVIVLKKRGGKTE